MFETRRARIAALLMDSSNPGELGVAMTVPVDIELIRYLEYTTLKNSSPAADAGLVTMKCQEGKQDAISLAVS